MKWMFYDAKNIPDITGWDVKKVEDMSQMFRGSDFNQDISNWDVGSVKDMGGMFEARVISIRTSVVILGY